MAVARGSCGHYVASLPCKLALPSGTIDDRICSTLNNSKLSVDLLKSDGRIKMIEQNKIVSLTVIGLVIGGILGILVNSEQVSAAALAAIGGVVGFLAGWFWNSRSGGSDESSSGGSEE